MKPTFLDRRFPLFVALIVSSAACTPSAEEADPGAGGDPAAAAEAPTNRIEVSSTVRRNLGITFAKVEARQVAHTIRISGAFELKPLARHEYRMSLPGHIQLLVDQFDPVEVDQPLFRFRSPAWPELLHEIILGEQEIATALAEIDLVKAKTAEATRKIALFRDRIDVLAQAEFKRADLESEAAVLEASLPRLAAEGRLSETHLANANRTREHALHRASTASGIPESELEALVLVRDRRVPAFMTVDWIEVRAVEPGIVESLAIADGAFAEPPSIVLSTVDTQQVRFRAMGLQADLLLLERTTSAQLVPPQAPGIPLGQSVAATTRLGLAAHPEERMIPLLATPVESAPWIRPGVSAFLEVVVDSTDSPELAVPRSAIVQDGLSHVFFRRDPSDPNAVIRVEADLGLDDGRWVVLKSGVMRGDEIVLDGAYELNLASQRSGAAARGGHVHADGTFHVDDEEGPAVLKRLIRFSIDHAALVLVLAGVLLGLAAYRLPRTPVDVFPELSAPTVVVMAEAPGLAADEVEQYVTFRVESAVNGIPGVRRVRTSSAIGLSIAYVEFEWGEDIYRARQLVSERLDSVREDLPPGTHAEMTPISSITGEIMLLAVSSPDGTQSALDLRAYAEFDLRNRLLAIPGVAQVSVIGGELPEYQVLVEQENLRIYGLTVEDVVVAAESSHSTLSAGYLSHVGNRELPIRQSGRVRSVSDIAGTMIKIHEGAPVTIGQVADVRLGAAPKRGTGADGGHPAVVMTLQKAPGTNTLSITEEVDELLDALDPTLPAGVHVNRQIFRQADFIDLAVHNVVAALRDAAIIVCIILALFLLNLRTTLVTLTALPLSLAAGLLALEALGETINVMTLGGLAIAVGSLVDDAIIDVENVFRRLNQNAARPESERRPRLEVLFDASNEIRPAMVFATIIIVLVFLPLMFLDGIEGRFFRPLGIAFVVSLIASLVVALTVTPALCKFFLHAQRGENATRVSFLVRWLEGVYGPAVRFALRWRALVLGAAAVATALTVWLGASFGTSFLPEFNEGTFTVGLFAPPGTSLRASDRIATSIESQILEIEGVRSVTRRTGRAERDEHAEPVSNSEIEITVEPGFRKEEVRARITAVLKQVPGITTNVGQPIEHRLSHILSGTPAAIAINVYGDDLATLRGIAKELERDLEALPGARDVAANREVMIQSLPIVYRPQVLSAYGLTPLTAAHQVRDAIFGRTVAMVNDGVRSYGLSVRLHPDEREDVEDVRRLVLRGAGGALVRLEEVADIGMEMSSNLIARENSQRKAVVSLNVDEGENLGHLVSEVQRIADPIVQRHGYTVKYGGQFEAQQSASRTIFLFSGVVLLVMIVLLDLAIGSLRVSLLVLVNLPLALIGGVLAVFVSESADLGANVAGLFGSGAFTAPVLSIASLVGFITLFGIAVRNGILLVNHYRYLVDNEGCSLYEAIVKGSLERLVPILMTALTAALALVPIVLEGDQPGNEILAPLSVVILGGLLTSTFLNLVIVPAGYAAIHRAREPRPATVESPVAPD